MIAIRFVPGMGQTAREFWPAQATVLVADDDPDLRHMLRDLLEFEGLRVIEASTGPEAWALIQREKPPVVIADVQMPGHGVMELCRLVKKAGLKSRVIAFTAGMATEGEAQQAGCDGYLLKTEPLPRLQKMIRRMLISAARGSD